MWCTHTLKPINPVATTATTIGVYPKMRRREKHSTRVEKMRAHQPIQQQQAAGNHHRRHGKYDGHRYHQLLPEQNGHAIESHSGSAMTQDCGREANSDA